MTWPWNLGYRSLKVIGSGTIRKLVCGFLFEFHSNYGSILYHFRDEVRYWPKIAIFSYPLCIRCPCYGGHRWSIAIPFGMNKVEWYGYPVVKNVEVLTNAGKWPIPQWRRTWKTGIHAQIQITTNDTFSRFERISTCDVWMDGQMNGILRQHSPRYA